MRPGIPGCSLSDKKMLSRFLERQTIGQKQALTAWLFLLIPILFYVIIRFYPTFEAFFVSTLKWNLLGKQKFIGFKNYIKLFEDEEFWLVLINTFKYALIGVPISLLFSFLIAYYLNEITFGHETIRALYFIPFLTTAVAMAWVWRWLYQPVPIGYFQIIIFLAGIRAIPQSHFEASSIDGAGRIQVLREIILPALRPTILFLVVISTIGFLRIFDQVYSMSADSAGGPLNSTKPLVLMIYEAAFDEFKMGYAAALTVVLFLILLVISLLQLSLMRRWTR